MWFKFCSSLNQAKIFQSLLELFYCLGKLKSGHDKKTICGAPDIQFFFLFHSLNICILVETEIDISHIFN